MNNGREGGERGDKVHFSLLTNLLQLTIALLTNHSNYRLPLMRTILHVDLDAFYAQVEMVRLGLDPRYSWHLFPFKTSLQTHKTPSLILSAEFFSIPLAVQQWNGLIAINYAARAFHIKRVSTD